ncbi:trehalose-phosphatase [Gordonia jinhuaensis]|uniref:Trehalose 6-phosphate phosphatase n=1 Tax=Gordonia jinhuaensis TaxID=1517702 RepID=A0A916SWG8_9ACTN|nr:trehalose-phosphatase [Gordonia jinhuaensis]GGB20917.1 trehalose 6-phosphate phosphatase [Gordonia jinhuaensis]
MADNETHGSATHTGDAAVARELPGDLVAALRTAASLPRLLVASDFDGCISPIVAHPADARPIPASIDALESLAAMTSTTAAIISGRALADLRELSGSPTGVHLVGSHGSEFDTGFALAITDDDTALLSRIVDELNTIAADYEGVTVESKPVSAALHVRNASPADGQAALERVRTGAATWDGVQSTEGKAVIELAVIDTDKGVAIHTLREQSGADAVVYLGDDVTDEKAFRVLTGNDVGIKVGDGETDAGYRIGDPDDVATTLTTIAALRGDAIASWPTL